MISDYKCYPITASYIDWHCETIIDRLYNEELDEDIKDTALIEKAVDLIKDKEKLKEELEFYILSHKNEVKTYKKLFGSKKDTLITLAKQNTDEWLKDLPIYNAYMEEITKRNLNEYLDILLERKGLK